MLDLKIWNELSTSSNGECLVRKLKKEKEKREFRKLLKSTKVSRILEAGKRLWDWKSSGEHLFARLFLTFVPCFMYFRHLRLSKLLCVSLWVWTSHSGKESLSSRLSTDNFSHPLQLHRCYFLVNSSVIYSSRNSLRAHILQLSFLSSKRSPSFLSHWYFDFLSIYALLCRFDTRGGIKPTGSQVPAISQCVYRVEPIEPLTARESISPLTVPIERLLSGNQRASVRSSSGIVSNMRTPWGANFTSIAPGARMSLKAANTICFFHSETRIKNYQFLFYSY